MSFLFKLFYLNSFPNLKNEYYHRQIRNYIRCQKLLPKLITIRVNLRLCCQFYLYRCAYVFI